MTKNMIFKILDHYEDEERKSGLYSYTFSNNNVATYRPSDPETIYLIWKHHLESCSKEILVENKNFPGEYNFRQSSTIHFNDIPEFDDYQIGYQVSYPYVAMIDVQEVVPETKGTILCNGIYKPTNINEERNCYIALNNMKRFIDIWDDKNYKFNLESWRTGSKEGLEYPGTCWCGIGPNQYTCNQFRFINNEYLVCSASYINNKNKARRHYREREYLFPYKSNKIRPTNALYVSVSSLQFYKDKALADKKKEIRQDLDKLLTACGVTKYRIIQINKLWKHI